MLCLFINFFNYTVDSFDRLTPAQAYTSIYIRSEIEQTRYDYYDNQIRLLNYYTVKAAFSDTKQIKNPSDLYPLRHDELNKNSSIQKLVEKTKIELTDFEKKLLFN